MKHFKVQFDNDWKKEMYLWKDKFVVGRGENAHFWFPTTCKISSSFRVTKLRLI